MNLIKTIAVLSMMLSCAPKHFQKYVLPSESPCVDGIIINIAERGCDAFFWGIRDETLKIRCTVADEQSWWTSTSFYFVPLKSQNTIGVDWADFCTDRTFRVHIGPTMLLPGYEDRVESSGRGFSGTTHTIKNGVISDGR